MKLKTIEFFLQPPYLLLVCCHAGVTIVQLSHYLIQQLRVSTYVKLLPKFSGDAQAIDQRLVLCHMVGSTEVQSNNIKVPFSLRRDHHYTSPGTVEGERAIEIHAPMLLSDQGGLLSPGPFGHKIHQGLGHDRRLGHVGYVEPHELERPLGYPSRGETVPYNFSEPK
jgi:hypothetical protein